MSFVNRSGEPRHETTGTSGAPPTEWDPADPDAVKVHYDVSSWGVDQRGELTAALAGAEIPHAWEGDELVVPEALERAVDSLFERLEAELGPFAVPLADGDPETEFGLDEWPAGDVETLRSALVEAEIPHRWDGTTVFVATDADEAVDDLLDAIERGDIASFDENALDGAPDGVLGDLYSLGDRLARDATDGGARSALIVLVDQLDAAHPPFGVANRSWSGVLDAAGQIVELFLSDTPDDEAISAAGDHLRVVTRPFV